MMMTTDIMMMMDVMMLQMLAVQEMQEEKVQHKNIHSNHGLWSAGQLVVWSHDQRQTEPIVTNNRGTQSKKYTLRHCT